MKVRFIEPVGYVEQIIVLWEGKCTHGPWHSARQTVNEHPTTGEHKLTIDMNDYSLESMPRVCETCGDVRNSSEGKISAGTRTRWSSGELGPQPGDIYWASWYHELQDDGSILCRLHKWDNCNDPRGHLIVVLPNGHTWDVDSRASNCTRKDERTHRCWVRHGDPPNITVDKNGNTCSAGAGSIIGGDWHGFLRNGELVRC